MSKKIQYLFILCLFFSCREEISIILNNKDEKIVVQGSIEVGSPPYVILTRNQGYFETIDENTFQELFIKDAKIIVNRDDGASEELEYFEFGGYGFYTNLEAINSLANDPNFIYDFSIEGKSYELIIEWDTMTINATTTIPNAVSLDSIWVIQTENLNDNESKCDIMIRITDPDTLGNNYLTRSKRVENWELDTLDTTPTEINRQDKNLLLIDCGPDILINGESFESLLPRPSESGGFANGSYNTFKYKKFDDSTTTSGKDSILLKNDKVLMKFSQVDKESMKFWRGVVRNSNSGGNPFSEPMNLSSNINGGLGIWTGYGTKYYLIPIIKDTTISEEYNPDIFDRL